MAGVTIPDTLNFGVKQGLTRIKSYQIPYSSTNLTYAVSSQTQIRIDIPYIGPNAYLETQSSFLSFRVSVATADVVLDSSAYSFLNTLSVYSLGQSVLLEQVTDHALLGALLWDLTSSTSSTFQTYSTLAGFSETERRGGATMVAGSSRTFCLPLLSILGLFTDKLLPMSTGFTLILGLNDINQAVQSAGAPTATIDNVFYYSAIHEVPSEVQQMILAANGGVLSVPCASYRSYSGTVAANTFTNSLSVGARFSSIKSVFVTQRPTTNLTAQASWTNTNRIKNFLTSYQMRLGSAFIPQRPVNSTTLCFANLMKAMHAFGQSQDTLLGFTDYIRDAAAGAAVAQRGSFAFGEDMELAATRKTSGTLCGTSSLGLSSWFLDTNYDTAQAPVASIINVLVYFDMVLSFTGQSVSVSF